MKIKILGFNWSLKGAVNVADLRSVLDSQSKKSLAELKAALDGSPVKGWEGKVFALSDKTIKGVDYWVGVVMKIRDQKRFCQVSGSTGRIKLSAKELEAGSKLVEINFFLFKPSKGRGIYQYYHHSTSPEVFAVRCRRWLDAFVENRMRDIVVKGNAQGWTQKRITEAKKAAAGYLDAELIVRSEDFAKLVNDLKTVRRVSVRLRDDKVKVSKLGLLREEATRTLIEFGFSNQTPTSKIKEGIADAVQNAKPWRMRVEGLNDYDQLETVSLADNIETFHEEDFDDAVTDLDLDLSDPAKSLESSTMVGKLIAIAQSKGLAHIME